MVSRALLEAASGPAVDGVAPRLEARPATVQEVGEVLRAAAEQDLAVLPVGGGTHLGIGRPPVRLDLALRLDRLNRVVEYEPADLTVTVEAGLPLADLAEVLAREGQRLPLDPPVAPASTVGGVVAANLSGPLRCGYGTARDLLIGTRVASADGTITRAGGRVVKNVAGYDLNKLHVGALGTLGILVELSFKLVPIPPVEAVVAVRLPDRSATAAAVAAITHGALAPLALDLWAPSGAGALGLPAADVLLAWIGGSPRSVERQRHELAALGAAHGAVPLDPGQGADTPPVVLRRVANAAADAAVRVRASAPPARLAELVTLLESRFGAAGAIVWARAATGVAYAACPGPVESATLAETRRAVRALGGGSSLAVEQAPPALKADLDVWDDPGASLAIMRALKRQLDPGSLLNPGRFVGGI